MGKNKPQGVTIQIPAKNNAAIESVEDFDVSKQIEKQVKLQLEKKVKEIEKKISYKEIKSTELLGIFVALFTFVSVNINIFTKVENLSTAIWFMIIMTACCLVIVGGLIHLINEDDISMERKCFFWIPVILLVLSLIVTKIFWDENWEHGSIEKTKEIHFIQNNNNNNVNLTGTSE